VLNKIKLYDDLIKELNISFYAEDWVFDYIYNECGSIEEIEGENVMDLTSAIIGHLIADYLLQFDFIAENKKKKSLICALHCFIWASLVCVNG